ncbi:MAG: ATP-binding cassette domain-containing protein [Planctomycetota bacterium]
MTSPGDGPHSHPPAKGTDRSSPGVGDEALNIQSLSVTLPNGRKLLQDANLSIARGQLVLLVGPSGSGKSTLLRLIAGLDDLRHGSMTIDGSIHIADLNGDGASDGQVGLVFQNHALFDELSAKANVQLAIDHRPRKGKREPEESARRLAELNVRPDAKPSTLSGGERQRVAVARTLAMDPPVLLFDEPTTGLDPARTRDVVDLIADTHARHGKTVVVVTHDYAPFLDHQPRLILLDTTQKSLRDVQADEMRERLGETQAKAIDMEVTAEQQTRFSWIGCLEEPGRAMVTLLAMLPAILGSWLRPKWKTRYLLYYTRMVTGPTTMLYVAIAGTMLGYTFVNFTFAQIPYKDVTVPLLKEEFLAATGYSTFRVIVPLLIAVLVAGKCGASIAADIGTRRYAHQFDALRNCRARPEHYLYGNIALALIVAVPLLTILAYVANCYASMVAFLAANPEGTVAMFQRNYFATVWPTGSWLPSGSGWVALKMSMSGMVVAGLSYGIGSRPKSSPVDVSRDVGLTIFWASLSVLLLHSIFSRIEF